MTIGKAMASIPYLPRATEYPDRNSLKDVRDRSLAEMLRECEIWSADMTRYRQALVTPAALVVWRALIVVELDMVAAAVSLVIEELEARVKSAPEEGTRASGGHILSNDEVGQSSVGPHFLQNFRFE